jgi:hypothetical protein
LVLKRMPTCSEHNNMTAVIHFIFQMAFHCTLVRLNLQ